MKVKSWNVEMLKVESWNVEMLKLESWNVEMFKLKDLVFCTYLSGINIFKIGIYSLSLFHIHSLFSKDLFENLYNHVEDLQK